MLVVLIFNLLVWLVMGALMGWLVSRLARTRHRGALWLNLSVGMVGALLAGLWIAPLIALPDDVLSALPSVDTIAVTSLGAGAVLGVVNAIPMLLGRRRLR